MSQKTEIQESALIKYWECLEIAWINVKRRKLRNGLTILGIVIAITTIFSLISISNGLDQGIRKEFEQIGTNRIYVTSTGSSITSLQGGLTDKDVEALEGMNEFLWVTPYLTESVTIEYNNKKKVVTAWATTTDDLEARWADINFKVEEGRVFADDEKYVTILGHKTATEMFDREIHINENIVINEKRFQIVGIFEEIGNPEDDNVVELPLETAQEMFGKENQVSIIELVVKKGTDIEEAAKETTRVLERKRGNDLFEVVTPDQLLQQFSTILLIINVILGAIASISLVVGGIGIMNSTYTSVLERRKEIGIMKAIGAENKYILFLFLAEAGMLGLAGGIIGIACGFGIAKVTQYGAEAAGFKLLLITLDPKITAFSMIFAVVFGIVAGALPARDAMKKQVVDVLRK
jgi:putative ABC transport system permease protein